MSHVLKNKLSIDVDDQIGLGNLGGVRIDGKKIEAAFFEPIGAGGDAPRATVAVLDEWKSWGRAAGVRFVPHNWKPFAGKSGSEAAKMCSDMIADLEKDGKRRVDVVEWDIETHDIFWQTEFLLGSAVKGTKGIRGSHGKFPKPGDASSLGYRWGRPGIWTMEGRQDTNTSVAHLAAATGLLIGPQCYDGAMTQIWDTWFEIETWVLNTNRERPNGARVPIEQFVPFYDARKSLFPVGSNEAVLFATSRVVGWL